MRLLADRLVELAVVDTLGPECVRTVLKKRDQAVAEGTMGDPAKGLARKVLAWEHARSACPHPVIWCFTTPDARIKLKRLYPSIQSG